MDWSSCQCSIPDREPTEGLLELTLPVAEASVPRARRAVRGWAETAGMSSSALDDLALAVTEACSNVVLHAYRPLPVPVGATFLVRAGSYRDRYLVVVLDDGCGPSYRPGSPGIGGGLDLIAKLTLAFELKDVSGTELLMVFPLI